MMAVRYFPTLETAWPASDYDQEKFSKMLERNLTMGFPDPATFVPAHEELFGELDRRFGEIYNFLDVDPEGKHLDRVRDVLSAISIPLMGILNKLKAAGLGGRHVDQCRNSALYFVISTIVETFHTVFTGKRMEVEFVMQKDPAGKELKVPVDKEVDATPSEVSRSIFMGLFLLTQNATYARAYCRFMDKIHDTFTSKGNNKGWDSVVHFINSKLFLGFDIMSRYDCSGDTASPLEVDAGDEDAVRAQKEYITTRMAKLRGHLSKELLDILSDEIVRPYVATDIAKAREDYILKCVRATTIAVQTTVGVLDDIWTGQLFSSASPLQVGVDRRDGEHRKKFGGNQGKRRRRARR
jgi:hypothetical protein